MEALLIYNPNAGGGAEEQAGIFQKELKRQGFEPIYRATKHEDELDKVLPRAKGVIVVVGGDGTLRAVTTRLIDSEVPIFLIPNGTANNVGRTLGLEDEPLEVLKQLGDARPVKMDLGRLTLPWGETHFLEGAGCGLFAEALARYQPEDGKSFLRGIKTLVELLLELPKCPLQMRLDGAEEEGEYLLVEAMNMGAIGPRLNLAPKADPHDGTFEVLKVRADQRDSYLAYLTALSKGEVHKLESAEVARVSRLEIKWDGFPIHQDASCLKADKSEIPEDTWITLDLREKCFNFLLPSVTKKAAWINTKQQERKVNHVDSLHSTGNISAPDRCVSASRS